jgi:hypothetical protein
MARRYGGGASRKSPACPFCGDSGIVEANTGRRMRCSCPKGREPDPEPVIVIDS